jgi:hypothetical protein
MIWLSILILSEVLILLKVGSKSSVVFRLLLILYLLVVILLNLPITSNIVLTLDILRADDDVVFWRRTNDLLVILVEHGGPSDLVVLSMLSAVDTLVLILNLWKVLVRLDLVRLATHGVLRLSHLLLLRVSIVLEGSLVEIVLRLLSLVHNHLILLLSRGHDHGR